MIFTSLTTMIISVAAMASVAVASDNLIISPMGLPCGSPNTVGCSAIKGWNNDNDFGYLCGPNSIIDDYQDCPFVSEPDMMCARGQRSGRVGYHYCMLAHLARLCPPLSHRLWAAGATVRAKHKSRTTDQVGLLKHLTKLRVKQSWWPGFRGGAPPSGRKNHTILKGARHQQHQLLRHGSIQDAEPRKKPGSGSASCIMHQGFYNEK
ncbi:uncharacterized protein F5891DRAFT_1173560 [Suillus fuscotomentosus]|uniref:Uncharacterized protein n=1 Tax=Suillus fuscotomentosus TaxID=1912939 RepID=A0AAD4E5F8_9AGAM|nr:uncharacterized protein F5891DRAFT_1175505 [Suillus fuscotomentosus]XP_041225263.1 uncharacterized protein F5891DRAFT_1173560 [Suillus fuscotomentosus]KAG1895621.1 hypothetical protein F5891DRAFT_1175505 [Suillus fuscotomentosus]KAG1899687.1 hypothetical protein F5891DRAFT_1173560 [Suillus fuscotomentosus]